MTTPTRGFNTRAVHMTRVVTRSPAGPPPAHSGAKVNTEAYAPKNNIHEAARAMSDRLTRGPATVGSVPRDSPRVDRGTAAIWSGIATIVTAATASNSPRHPNPASSVGWSENTTIMLAG